MALELVSIHVPKTAGTSLHQSFCDIYGQKNVVNLKRKHLKQNSKRVQQYIRNNTKVLHGHFHYNEIDEYILNNQDIKLVTWVRDPIKRLISNYHFFIKRARNSFPGTMMWFRRNETLLKYASRKETQNMTAQFLAPYNWSRFSYIGIQEQYSEDLIQMARKLNWSFAPEYSKNSLSYETILTKKECYYLNKWNLIDIEIYNEIVKKRNSVK